jgi:hypothetical protein
VTAAHQRNRRNNFPQSPKYQSTGPDANPALFFGVPVV